MTRHFGVKNGTRKYVLIDVYMQLLWLSIVFAFMAYPLSDIFSQPIEYASWGFDITSTIASYLGSGISRQLYFQDLDNANESVMNILVLLR